MHLAILGYTVALIVGAGQPDWPMYWTIFLALDFPVSLAVVPLAWIFPPSPPDRCATSPISGGRSASMDCSAPCGGTSWGRSIGDRLSRFADANPARQNRNFRGQQTANPAGRGKKAPGVSGRL